MKVARLVLAAAPLLVVGCTGGATPLRPGLDGSIGLPHQGSLTGSVELPREGTGYAFLRDDDRHHALPRFARAIERAAALVATERPGGTLVLGDLSRASGGRLLPHLSHRSGRDADLVFYAQTLDGAPVAAPGFVHYGPDGLAWDDAHQRYLRIDLDREWLLVRALLEDPEARILWMFCHHAVKAKLLAWGLARGEPTELLWRAEQVLAEPHPGGLHDDHLHVRTACDADDVEHGCEPNGPARAWLALPPAAQDDADDAALARALLAPIDVPSEAQAAAVPAQASSGESL